MKLRRIPKFSSDHGSVEFVPVDNMPGFSHRVAFNGVLRMHWLPEDKKPNVKAAVFFIRVCCAERDGLSKYHYADRNIDPPLATKLSLARAAG